MTHDHADPSEHSQHGDHEHGEHGGNGHDHQAHHAHMVADFRRRFWICAALTVPVLALSPMIRQWLGLSDALSFAGDAWALLALSSVIFFYGGKPFLTGLASELGDRRPGMMTLIGIAISVAYAYSVAVVFGLAGKLFFWETATLIDLMLLGHWIEMRSVMGASRALEELAREEDFSAIARSIRLPCRSSGRFLSARSA